MPDPTTPTATITLTGIRIKTISFTRKDDGSFKPEGTYELMASNGKSLASQCFNSYNDNTKFSAPVTAQFEAALLAISNEIAASLGFPTS